MKTRWRIILLIKELIETNVPDGIQPANYRIGRLSNWGYNIIYVGMVDYRQDRGLKDLLIEHLDDFEGDYYFEWNKNDSILDAYKRECKDYHCWSSFGDLEKVSIRENRMLLFSQYVRFVGTKEDK